jgi:hypothetical protein
MGPIAKVRLVLLSYALINLGFTLRWVAHASALRDFGWFNEHSLIWIYLCYHSCNARILYAC